MSRWFKDIAASVRSKLLHGGNKTFVGSDKLGNKYFVVDDKISGRQARVAETPEGDSIDTTVIPVEWYSWLHGSRTNAPSEQLQHKLEKYRDTAKKNAIAYDEEQQRLELQNQVNQQQQGSQQRGPTSNAPPSFDYVLKRARHEDESSTTVAPSTQKKDPITPDSRLARDTTARPSHDHTTFSGTNLTNLDAQQVRSEVKKFSGAKTSPFLGVKPQVRQNVPEEFKPKESK